MKITLKSLVPASLRNLLKRQLGIQFLLEQNEMLARRVTLLENKFYGSLEEQQQDAKSRWANSQPDAVLTWGEWLPGNAFIVKARDQGLFGPARSILEIGPGYGRLLQAMLEEGTPFSSYLGVDISANQVDFLSKKFAGDTIRFMQGDVETFTTDERFDTVISSLTFKHLFPSFSKAITNLSQLLKPGGSVFIDFIEGNRRLFEADGVTFIRHYSRAEITAIMTAAGLDQVTFDQVTHAENYTRLVATAHKPRQVNS